MDHWLAHPQMKQEYFQEAGNSFQHFFNSYILKDEHYHCLTSDATIMGICKYPIIGKQVAIIYFT